MWISPYFIYYSNIHTSSPATRLYTKIAETKALFIIKAKQVYFENLPTSWSQKKANFRLAILGKALDAHRGHWWFLSIWVKQISIRISELHLEFIAKLKHLHSFTPPIPADQLINRALTPAVYLPLNTPLIRLHPPRRLFLAEGALDCLVLRCGYSLMHMNAKRYRSTIQTV